MSSRAQPWRWVFSGALVAAALVPSRWIPLPPDDAHIVRAILIIAAGYVLTSALERRLAVARWSRDGRRAGLVRLLIRLFLYVVIGTAVLGALGVKLTQITFGGALITVVIGLAGQTLFSNVLSGVVLVIWRPFEIGDDVSIVSWQIPLLAGTRSHETISPGNRARIRDVNLLHTIGVGDDGQLVMIPNSVMLQAIVRNHSHSGAERLRVVADAEKEINTLALWARLQQLGKDLTGRELPIQGEPTVRLLELNTTGTAFVVETWVTSTLHLEDVRSAILVQVATLLQELRAVPHETGKP